MTEEQQRRDETVSHQIWMLIMKLYNEHNKVLAAELKVLGINPTQFEVLHFIREHEPVDQKTIAAHLNVTQGNITQCIYKLRDLGWITHRKQWKTKYISLTENGHALMCRLIPHQQAQIESALQGLTKTEQQMLQQLLAKFANTCKKNND